MFLCFLAGTVYGLQVVFVLFKHSKIARFDCFTVAFKPQNQKILSEGVKINLMGFFCVFFSFIFCFCFLCVCF